MKNAGKVKTIYSREYRALLDRLRDLRRRAGLTQRALAARLGVHPSWVAKVEIGERRLDVIETIRLLRALDVQPLPVFKELLDLMK